MLFCSFIRGEAERPTAYCSYSIMIITKKHIC